jgi:hypothetical protein
VSDAAVCEQALWLAKCLAADSYENTAALANAGLPQASIAAGRAHPNSESVQEVKHTYIRIVTRLCDPAACL